jgi:hypothetical protein
MPSLFSTENNKTTHSELCCSGKLCRSLEFICKYAQNAHTIIRLVDRFIGRRHVYLVSRVRPRAEYDRTRLIVEWEQGHVIRTVEAHTLHACIFMQTSLNSAGEYSGMRVDDIEIYS